MFAIGIAHRVLPLMLHLTFVSLAFAIIQATLSQGAVWSQCESLSHSSMNLIHVDFSKVVERGGPEQPPVPLGIVCFVEHVMFILNDCTTRTVCTTMNDCEIAQYTNECHYLTTICLQTTQITASVSRKLLNTGSVCTSSPNLSLRCSASVSGDSYTQTGFVPNGTLPAIGNPLGNPPYPGLTATPGANWVDFVTTTYNNSLVFTYNYAYGGATIDATLVQPYTPTVLSLTDQVNEFLNTVASKPATTSWKSSDTLFSVWIGINDIGHSYYLSGDRNAYATFVRGGIFGD